jgi:hypothetical protein
LADPSATNHRRQRPTRMRPTRVVVVQKANSTRKTSLRRRLLCIYETSVSVEEWTSQIWRVMIKGSNRERNSVGTIRDGSTCAEMIYLMFFFGLPLRARPKLYHGAHSGVPCLDWFLLADSYRKQMCVRPGCTSMVRLNLCGKIVLCSAYAAHLYVCTWDVQDIVTRYFWILCCCNCMLLRVLLRVHSIEVHVNMGKLRLVLFPHLGLLSQRT